MKLIDNFLDEGTFNNLRDMIVYGNKFPLFCSNVLSENEYVDLLCEDKYNLQLGHTLYKNYLPNSEAFYLIIPILEKLEVDALIKAKVNFNPCTEKIIEHGYHIDYPSECLTAVYYLNTNNGYTKFETGQVIDSVENRIVIFNSSVKHTGSTCTNTRGRYVLNLNFYSESITL